MPSRKLGQHFLHNTEILRRIADALSLQSGDMVIEIGPGRGALTREIIANCRLQIAKFIAIEKDERLAQELQIANCRLQIITGDALKVLPELAKTFNFQLTTYKLVGNIPYYITGKLFRIIGELPHKPETTVLMIQKEVAERVTAKPPKMNLLAASVQAWAETEYLFSVSRREFKPMPKVESAVIRLKPLRNYELSESTKHEYYELVRKLFKQPRKTILNNLCDGLKRSKSDVLPMLRKLNLNEHSRPQEMSVPLIIKLLQML